MITVVVSIVGLDPAAEAALLRTLSTGSVQGEFNAELADTVGRMVSPLVRIPAGAMRIEVRIEEATG